MNNKAFTLLELLLALLISILVMAGIFYSFNTVINSQIQQSKIAESDISSLMGLEIIRKDIELAGFALPWSIDPSVSYSEASSDSDFSPSPDFFNDAPSSVPRPFVLADNLNTSARNSDVLAIKSSVLNYESSVSQKYGILYFDSSSSSWSFNRYSLNDLSDGDYYIILSFDRSLISSSTWYCSSLSCPLLSGLDVDLAYLYAGLSSVVPRMPFNRVDYYLKRPSSFPSYCSPNSYVLYRSLIKHSDGSRNEQPILDCVMDFQVSFGLDTNSDGFIDIWSSGLPSDSSTLRNQVKQVKIFIIYQEGQYDPNFISSSSYTLGDNDTGILSIFTPTDDDVHYRWKILKLAVNPLNLLPQDR